MKTAKSSIRQATTITLTGERRRGAFQLLISGTEVFVRRRELSALIDLIVARATRTAGYLALSSVVVCRLRAALDDALGRGRGTELIETGFGHEYRLWPSAARLAAHFKINPAFSEMLDLKVLVHPQAQTLLRLLGSQRLKRAG